MEKTFNPEKYNMAFCPLCNGNGKLPKNPDGFDVCKECGGFGLIKKESEILGQAKDYVRRYDTNDKVDFHLIVGNKQETSDCKKDFFSLKNNRKSFNSFDISFNKKGGEME